MNIFLSIYVNTKKDSKPLTEFYLFNLYRRNKSNKSSFLSGAPYVLIMPLIWDENTKFLRINICIIMIIFIVPLKKK